MRSLVAAPVLAMVLTACGDDPAPPSAPQPAPRSGPDQPAAAAATSASAAASNAVPEAKPAEAAATAERERAAARALATVADLIATAARGDAVAKGKAPAEIKALGDSALPGLAVAVLHRDVTHRRLAALTLLQWDAIPAGSAAITALERARNDADPAVRAAAEHAWRRATGDSSALDQSRAAHEEAVRKAR